MKKVIYLRQKCDLAAKKEEFIDIAWACRDCTWKFKIQLEVGFARNIKVKKESCSCFLSGKRLNKGNVAENLVKVDQSTEQHFCLFLQQDGLSGLCLPGSGVPLGMAHLKGQSSETQTLFFAGATEKPGNSLHIYGLL